MYLKRISIITLALVLTLTTFSSILSIVFAKQTATLGDINGNGEIDSMDYVLLKRAYFGTYNLNDNTVGDVNGNGIIDSMDYVLLKRAYFGTYTIQVPDDEDEPSFDDSQPENSQPDLSEPEPDEPGSSEPESSEPESSEPESSEPESSEPESSEPESSEPESSEPESSEPESSEPESSEPESSEPESSEPESSEPESSEPESSEPEITMETIVINGDLADNGWHADEWTEVGNKNGYWQTIPSSIPTSDTLSYRYQIHTDDSKLYVAVEIDCSLVVGGNGSGTNVRFWINTNNKASVYTHFYDVNASACASKYNTSTTSNSSANISNSSLNGKMVGGKNIVYAEFSIDLDEFGGENGFTYYIAVSNKKNNNLCLYHPAVTPSSSQMANLPYNAWDYTNDAVADIDELKLKPHTEPEAVKPVTLTQTSVITNENFTSVSAFSEFLSSANRSILLPGLKEPIVPQGLARNPKTGYIYVTAYYSDSSKPSVILVMNPKGEFVAEYFVYNANGNKYTGHMGGICVTENYLYFSGPTVSGNYTVAEFALSDLPLSGSHNITINNTVAIPINASHLFYDEGILWAGNFYLEGSYDLGKLFNFKTTNADGTQYGGYVAAFEVNKSTKRLVVDSDMGYATPFHVLAVPDKVQGFAYMDGKVALSISYGRNNNSVLGFYEIDIYNYKKTIAVDAVTYGLTILDSTNRIKNVTAMCMTEGMTLSKNGKLLILFESAAQTYYNSKNPTDYIWEFDFPN